VIFHGGEPLLFGRDRFEQLLTQVAQVGNRTKCYIRYFLTTNGILLDDNWAKLLAAYDVSCTISIDGPENIHDRARLDKRGRGTHRDAVRGMRLLRKHDVPLGVLAVCDPTTLPHLVVDFIVDHLSIRSFDVLVPDPDGAIKPQSIARYYIDLFEYVYFSRSTDRIRIRFFENVIRGMLGGNSMSESIGAGAVTTVTLLTDGALEPVDVLRTLRAGKTLTRLNVGYDSLESIKTDRAWQEVFIASVSPCQKCQECRHSSVCGGGPIASRFHENSFDNPSIYCNDYMAVLDHVWHHLESRLKFIET